jgi:DNA-binding NtrC family response regulator
MDKKLVVLVCDDDSLMLQVLSLRLRSMFEVHTSSSVDQAEVMLDNIKFDIAIIDINYKEQKKTGADLQDVFSRRSPATSILIYSGDNNIRRIVDVTDRKHTAVIVKGEDAFCDLITALDKMAKTILGDRLTSKGNMVTFSPKMQKVLNRIDTIIVNQY